MLVAYLYDISGNIVAQFMRIGNFQCRKILNDVWTCTFSVDSKTPEISLISEFLRCRVVLVANRGEKTIFDGVIRSIGAISNTINITLNDFNFLLKKKKLYSDKTYTNVSIGTILYEILSEINARYDTGISLQTTETTPISKEYKANISLLDVLSDLAESGYEFDVVDMKLLFAQTIGEDKTTGPDFVEFRHNISIPNENSVSEYSILRDADNISNAVTWTSGTGSSTQTDSASIAKFGRIEEVYTVDWDLTNATAAMLEERKESITEVSVTPITNDYFLTNLGDKVKVYIDGGNTIQFFDGNMKVVEKAMTFGIAKGVDVRLSTTKVSTMSLMENILDIKRRLKKIEV